MGKETMELLTTEIVSINHNLSSIYKPPSSFFSFFFFFKAASPHIKEFVESLLSDSNFHQKPHIN